jgi:hypothetical protein
VTPVFVGKTAELVAPSDRANRRRLNVGLQWRNESKAAVGTGSVVVVGIGTHGLIEVAAAEDEQPIETLRADRPDKPFSVGVGKRVGFVYSIPLQMRGIGWRDRVCEPYGLNSPGHRANMLSSSYQTIGVALQGMNGSTIATTDFGGC